MLESFRHSTMQAQLANALSFLKARLPRLNKSVNGPREAKTPNLVIERDLASLCRGLMKIADSQKFGSDPFSSDVRGAMALKVELLRASKEAQLQQHQRIAETKKRALDSAVSGSADVIGARSRIHAINQRIEDAVKFEKFLLGSGFELPEDLTPYQIPLNEDHLVGAKRIIKSIEIIENSWSAKHAPHSWISNFGVPKFDPMAHADMDSFLASASCKAQNGVVIFPINDGLYLRCTLNSLSIHSSEGSCRNEPGVRINLLPGRIPGFQEIWNAQAMKFSEAYLAFLTREAKILNGLIEINNLAGGPDKPLPETVFVIDESECNHMAEPPYSADHFSLHTSRGARYSAWPVALPVLPPGRSYKWPEYGQFSAHQQLYHFKNYELWGHLRLALVSDDQHWGISEFYNRTGVFLPHHYGTIPLRSEEYRSASPYGHWDYKKRPSSFGALLVSSRNTQWNGTLVPTGAALLQRHVHVFNPNAGGG